MPIVSLEQFLAQSNNQQNPFDYLILGGGTAGLVVAHRLAANSNIKVGVIEAGIYHGPSGAKPIIDTPGLVGRALNDPLYNWGFQTAPQANANNRVVPQSRGKGIGGSSIINFLGLTRPSQDEYDALEGSFNNHNWTWNRLLSCMKKSERFTQYETLEIQRSTASPGSYIPTPTPSVHGKEGPIHHSHPPQWPSRTLTEPKDDTRNLTELFLKSMNNLGVPENPEPCGGYNIGSSKPLTTIDPETGHRSSAASGYFESIIETIPNLLVLTEATVTRILFDQVDDPEKPKAIGAEIFLPSHDRCVEIRNVLREIIISTGSLKTPDILECSGIGDPTILVPHGVNSLVDLPGVGNNLQDHFSVSVTVEVDSTCVTSDILLNPEEFKKHQALFDEKKEGLLADSPVQGFSNLSLQQVSHITGTLPDFITQQLDLLTQQYIHDTRAAHPVQRGYEKQCQLQKRWLSDPDQAQIEIINFTGHPPKNPFMPDPAAEKRYLTLLTSLMHPFSRGTVHHTPPSSLDRIPHPKIDPKIISHPMDRELLLQGLECIIHLTQTEPLKRAIKSWVIPSQLGTLDLETLKSHSAINDATLKSQLRNILEEHLINNVRTSYHSVGTAAMMPREDGGVVDEHLRVYGVTGLRVADLSILPYEISSHTVSAAYAIGEMASDFLLEDYNRSTSI